MALPKVIEKTKNATEAAPGVSQLATATETITGTINTKATHPNGVSATIANKFNTLTTIKTTGSTGTSTGYKIADGKDIAELFGTIKTINLTTSGTGNVIGNITISTTNGVTAITQNKITAMTGYCTYCTHCTQGNHCTFCSYCAYCTYCTYVAPPTNCAECGHCVCDCSCN